MLSTTNFDHEHLLKKNWFSRSSSYEFEVIITSLIEMLELANSGHMTKSTISFKSRDKILLVMSFTEIIKL